MADIIEINIGTLGNDITQMETEINALRDGMKKTFESVTELDAMWSGPANDAFNQAFSADHQAMNEMCRILDSLVDYMENARDEYRRCEAAVSTEIDTIRI
ncbi:MAG: WXG100 family type VII secretion target [Lachnospiraceae bacterium]|nr:WXG100 family type VII secretion target [Lachnospiraceae bacterium]